MKFVVAPPKKAKLSLTSPVDRLQVVAVLDDRLDPHQRVLEDQYCTLLVRHRVDAQRQLVVRRKALVC